MHRVPLMVVVLALLVAAVFATHLVAGPHGQKIGDDNSASDLTIDNTQVVTSMDSRETIEAKLAKKLHER
jgi:hypothetical protein